MRSQWPLLNRRQRHRRGRGRCHWAETAIGAAIFFAALAYFNTTLHVTLELRDEGFLFYNISRAAHGEIPHRDFAEVYGPGFYALTAPIFRLFGDRILPIRELVAAVRAAAVVCAYLIARRLVPRSFALIAAFMATAYWGRVIWNLNAPYAALFTIFLCMTSLVLLLRGQSSGRRSAYFWSGAACGAALLFKWSLAAASAYGMVLAIGAQAMLRQAPAGEPRDRVRLVLLVWTSMGLLIILPFVPTLTPFAYLVHFAPVHGVIAAVGIRFARFGDGRRALARAVPLWLRYGVGLCLFPICAGALYACWGSLDDLLYNMAYRPFRLRNYPLPVEPPDTAAVLHLVCLICWIGAGLALLRGARRGAALFAVGGGILAPAAYPALAPDWNPSSALQSLSQVQNAGLSAAVLVLLARFLAQPRPTDAEPQLNALISVLLFQEMMTFQIFPRASYNVTLMLGTLTPAVAWIAYRAYALVATGDTPEAPARRTAAFSLAALLPLLLVGHIAYDTLSWALAPEEKALHSPALAGIRPRPHPFAPTALQEFDALLEHLETVQPSGAPVFALPNEFMIYFASGRDHLFRDHALALFLAGWDFLPENDRDTPSQRAMIRRLERTPEAIVITRVGDRTQAQFEALFPAVSRYIERRYRIETEIGDYRLRRLELPRERMRP